jgi:hypothetical protein
MKKQNTFRLLIIVFILSLIFSYGGCGGGSGGNNKGEPSPATLSWDAPTTNADGSELDDLAGYKVYFGYSSRNYTEFIDIGMPPCQKNDGKTTCTYTLTSIPANIYFFAVTAYDTSGNMSTYSNEVRKTIR